MNQAAVALHPSAALGELAQLRERVDCLERSQPEDRLALLVFSGDMDKLMAAFLMATAAAAMGTQVTMFFTFWGLAAVKKKRVFRGKSFWERVLAFMLPKGPDSVPTSNMNMGGIGPRLFNMLMGKKNVQSLPQLVQLASELGVEMFGCQMSMNVMGIHREELVDELQCCGAAAFLGKAQASRNAMFV